jgi:hypothetical protein
MMKLSFLALFALLFSSVNGFVTPKSNSLNTLSTRPVVLTPSTTSLSERQWNFNEGRGPFGLKKNAEIWNGRFAQMCFIVVLIQELVTGQGVVQGLQEGTPVAFAMVGFTGLSLLALTAFLGIKGKTEFINLNK